MIALQSSRRVNGGGGEERLGKEAKNYLARKKCPDTAEVENELLQ